MLSMMMLSRKISVRSGTENPPVKVFTFTVPSEVGWGNEVIEKVKDRSAIQFIIPLVGLAVVDKI